LALITNGIKMNQLVADFFSGAVND